ncbi:MAG: hypothetical protein B6D46_05405 [Polyangiaceae bacterium UTPRO1]|nr:MAG: hypothetical protein B6D46_05405 [Polyangiaceae bacterium UTPRO1]
MMDLGAKRASNRRVRRVLPDAERRLRSSFPEVWAWYELLVAARATGAAAERLRGPEASPRRSSSRC